MNNRAEKKWGRGRRSRVSSPENVRKEEKSRKEIGREVRVRPLP